MNKIVKNFYYISKNKTYTNSFFFSGPFVHHRFSSNTNNHNSNLRESFFWNDTGWIIQRGTAILILLCLLFGNISFLAATIILISLHLYIGVTEILTDYIHNEVTRVLLNSLFGILLLIILKENLVNIGLMSNVFQSIAPYLLG